MPSLLFIWKGTQMVKEPSRTIYNLLCGEMSEWSKSVNIILVPRVQIPLFPPRNISKIRENRNGKKESN